MRAAAYQLLDGQRALGNYKLPEKWICVGLGNGPDDGGVFNGAEAALFTRCYGFRVAPNLESFKEYAQNRISKDLHEGFMTHDLVLSLVNEFEVDLSYAEGSEQLLSRASDNEQLMRILHYAEKLSPEMLNTIEIQLKALAEQSEKE